MPNKAKVQQAAFFELLRSNDMPKDLVTFAKGLRDVSYSKKSVMRATFFVKKAAEIAGILEGLDADKTQKVLAQTIEIYNNRIAKLPLLEKDKEFDKIAVRIFEEIDNLQGLSVPNKAAIFKMYVGMVSKNKDLYPQFRVKRLGCGDSARMVRI